MDGRWGRGSFVCAVMSVLVAGAARAEEPAPEPPDRPGPAAAKEAGVTVRGTYWIHGAYTSDFPLSEDGALWRGRTWPDGIRDGLEVRLDHRLRIEAEARPSRALRLVGSADIAGALGGDTTDIGKDTLLVRRDRVRFYDRSTVREAYLEWTSSAGVLRVGQMTSSWGLGLVANDGADREDAFHDALLGDLVERVLFVTRPIQAFSDSGFARHFHVGIGGDLVYRDDHASLVEGDLAAEGVALVFYDGPVVRGGDDLFAGVYAAYRHQRDDNGDRLKALAVDAAFRHVATLDSRGTFLRVEGEGAFVLGSLRFADRGGPPRAKDGADIRQWGAVLRAEVYVPDAGLQPGIEAGVASGDADPLDDVGRAFHFDPDYQVGMILFQEVLGRMSALQPERVSDPDLLYKAPSGYKQAATNGSVTNAVYVVPRVRYWPLPDLEVRLAFLWARGLAPVSGAYNAAGHGGYPLGYRVDPRRWTLGKWVERDLGMEVDGGIAYTVRFAGRERLRLGVQGGWCRAGAAFRDASGDRLPSIVKVRVLADLAW